MKYNFDEKVSRRGTHSIKWDTASDPEILPMWIADMDYLPLPEIAEALAGKASEGFFGYNTVPSEFFQAIADWWEKQHQYIIDKSWILPATGVVSGLSAAIRALTSPGDGVIIQTPTYNHFFNLITGSGCEVVTNELIYHEGRYFMDFQDLALKAGAGKTKLLLLCNPQNPVGRVWTGPELEEMAMICKANNILVLSDEIHSDLVYPDFQHIPFGAVAVKYGLPSVTCSSASKTFNLSGLQAAYMFASDPAIRKRIEKQLWAQASASPGLLAISAMLVSYQRGQEWLDQVKVYLRDNYNLLQKFISENLSLIKVVPLEATYLVWLDCSATGVSSAELSESLLKAQKLWVNAGEMYGKSGEGFLRINIACRREVLQEGLNRLRDLLILVNPVKPPLISNGI